MMNLNNELHESKYINVWHNNKKRRVLVSDLRYLPITELAEQHIESWKKVFISFGEVRSADVKFVKTSDNRTEVTLLIIYNDGGREKFIYNTDGVEAEAVEWRGLTDASGAMLALLAFGTAGISALVIFFLSKIILRLFACTSF